MEQKERMECEYSFPIIRINQLYVLNAISYIKTIIVSIMITLNAI